MAPNDRDTRTFKTIVDDPGIRMAARQAAILIFAPVVAILLFTLAAVIANALGFVG